MQSPCRLECPRARANLPVLFRVRKFPIHRRHKEARLPGRCFRDSKSPLSATRQDELLRSPARKHSPRLPPDTESRRTPQAGISGISHPDRAPKQALRSRDRARGAVPPMKRQTGAPGKASVVRSALAQLVLPCNAAIGKIQGGDAAVLRSDKCQVLAHRRPREVFDESGGAVLFRQPAICARVPDEITGTEIQQRDIAWAGPSHRPSQSYTRRSDASRNGNSIRCGAMGRDRHRRSLSN